MFSSACCMLFKCHRLAAHGFTPTLALLIALRDHSKQRSNVNIVYVTLIHAYNVRSMANSCTAWIGIHVRCFVCEECACTAAVGSSAGRHAPFDRSRRSIGICSVQDDEMHAVMYFMRMRVLRAIRVTACGQREGDRLRGRTVGWLLVDSRRDEPIEEIDAMLVFSRHLYA
jgi:hypothetical protein